MSESEPKYKIGDKVKITPFMSKNYKTITGVGCSLHPLSYWEYTLKGYDWYVPEHALMSKEELENEDIPINHKKDR